MEASSDDSYYLTVKLKQDKFTNLILAIRNASAPVWDSGNIVADYYDLDNYYYSSNSFSIILAPQTYNLETLKIGVYSNVSLIYIISARQSLQKPCFDNCSDKGKCLSGACVCNYGFFGKECRISAERLEMDVKTVIFSRNDYYFYEFENKDEKLEIEIESDTKIEVYTKPDAGYLTLLPSQAEYYKKYSGKSIKFEVKNKGFGNFYLYVQNIANLSISVKSFND